MNFLIVNDDSIHAPGIALLARAAAELGEVTVVAPEHQCSAMSQRITIETPMALRRYEEFPAPVKAAWSLEGMPADCVKAALCHLMPEPPDFVLSGINAGWNAGFDIVHSGTLGAAFEARMLGVPAIAFSNAHGASWELPEAHLTQLLRELTALPPPKHAVWNINFPGCGIDACRGIRRDRLVAPIPLFREWFLAEEQDGVRTLTLTGVPLAAGDPVPAGSDFEALLEGYISVGTVACSVMPRT